MATPERLGGSSNAYRLGTLVVVLPVCYVLTLIVYRLYFHPLARFPGPLLHRISRIPHLYKHVNGTLPFDMLGMHERYGDIVRIAPDELAISHPDAWNQMLGHVTKSQDELRKAEWFYKPFPDLATNLVNEGREQHGRLRRTLANGFSEKSMREQQPTIQKYVNLLISKLRERSGVGKGPVIISDWYNFCTFDVIGDLVFGEAFGCLESSNYHAWVKGIFAAGRFGTIIQSLSFVPPLRAVLLSFAPKKTRDDHATHKKLTRAKMLKRIEAGGERHDLIEGLLKKQGELGLSIDDLVANAEILIIGGSETTATLLSGVTYYLLMNPSCLERLVHEVRSAFEDEEEIDLISVNKLTYMLACLNEGLRMYPPVANGLPRVVPASGTTILGEFIPPETIVAIHHWALYRRRAFWHKPEEFHPERHLGAPEFDHDRRDALQSFHVGPRNCLGRNLAYSEMRLILARLVWNFDMRIADDARDWVKQKNYIMWKKGPLNVELVERKR